MTIEDLQSNEVLSWRQKRLVTLGFDPEHASEIAQTTLDLYELEHLLGRGCPPHTAVAILLALISLIAQARLTRRA